ncbi:MAG: hypothetical protein WDW38_008828 [Sanguina aurantia]
MDCKPSVRGCSESVTSETPCGGRVRSRRRAGSGHPRRGVAAPEQTGASRGSLTGAAPHEAAPLLSQETANQELMQLASTLPDTPEGCRMRATLAPEHQRTVGYERWWSPLLPLLVLPNITDFRVSAKEGLVAAESILFDEVLTSLVSAWPAVERLCFKGCINVSPANGWASLQTLSSLQALELRHHPIPDAPEPQDAIARALRAKTLKVEPIRIPAHSLPSGLQHLLLENVELRRRDADSLTSLVNLERRTTCRHFPEFGGMPLTRLVVSNCCVKAKGIASIAADCTALIGSITMPARIAAGTEPLRTSLPSTVTRPRSSCMTPAIALSVSERPEPSSPPSPTTSPGRICIATPSIWWRRLRSSAIRTGGAVLAWVWPKAVAPPRLTFSTDRPSIALTTC